MTARARVHVKQPDCGVPHHLQYVGVTADEKPRPQLLDFLPGTRIVIAGIAADMGHIHLDAFTLPGDIPSHLGTDLRAVNVPVNAAHRLEVFETIKNLRSPEVSRVPYLIALGKVPEDSIVQKSVGVSEQTNPQTSSYKARCAASQRSGRRVGNQVATYIAPFPASAFQAEQVSGNPDDSPVHPVRCREHVVDPVGCQSVICIQRRNASPLSCTNRTPSLPPLRGRQSPRSEMVLLSVPLLRLQTVPGSFRYLTGQGTVRDSASHPVGVARVGDFLN